MRTKSCLDTNYTLINNSKSTMLAGGLISTP